MSQGRRVERVAAMIRREVSHLLLNGIKDARVHLGMVTITKVEVSGDLQRCKIFVSIYSEESQKNHVMSGLNASTGFLRGELGRKLQLRRAPEIIFYLDKGLEKGTAVLSLLESLKQKSKSEKDSASDNE